MRIIHLLAGAVAGMALVPANAATTIRFENIKGEWFDAVAVGSNSSPSQYQQHDHRQRLGAPEDGNAAFRPRFPRCSAS